MKRITRLIGSLISIVLVLSCLPLESIADEIADSLKCRSLNEASYTVQENVITEWPGQANIEITFTNIGDTPIYNWNFSFDYPYNIENPYCCSIVEHEGDLYTITNSRWNKDINPGESVTIGFTASSNDGSNIEVMPSFYLLNNEQTTLPEGAVTVEYQEYSDWTTGSSGVLILTNNTESAIGSWTFSFSANRPITDAYGFTLSSNEDGTYTITGDGYTEIPAEGSVQIGIQCGEHDPSVPFEVTNVSIYSSALAINLNEDSNGNGIPDVAEIDSTGFIDITTPTPTAEPTTTETPTDTPTDTPEPTPTEFVFTPDQDLDGDGLYTSEEEMYGTDPNNPDSDSDGVCDGYEIKMFYLPTIADSDGNGILDGDEDYDGDGIINREEEAYGTCLYAADSDYDDINDYEEIFTYSTDPYEEDSDGDYILDGDELALGLDPTTDTTESVQDNENTEDYSFATTSDQIAVFNTDDQPFSFSFDITAAGRVDKYIKVQETGYKYAIEDNSTILGKSPEIVYDYAMKVDSVTVNFTMKNGYEADIDKYCVFYYWEGYNILIPIETEYDYDTGTVYATNSMIGTYCLVDTDQMYDLLGVEETTESSTSFASDYPAYYLLSSTDSTELNYTTSSVYEFNGHKYLLITADTPMTYEEAIGICAKEGGYPAVITSEEENGFLYDLRGGVFSSCWLGGLVIREGNNRPTVQWITGEECVYDCWAVLYSGGVEGTLIQGLIYQMNGWAWVNLETATERRVICECSNGTEPNNDGKTISALTFGEDDIKLNCYSDSDIDGDGLLDYEELSSLDLGTYDSTTGEYTASGYNVYLSLAISDGINADTTKLDALEKANVISYKSSVNNSNIDEDNANDLFDDDSLYVNPDMIYILYLSQDKTCKDDANIMHNAYVSSGLDCQRHSFLGYDQFVDIWNDIGDDLEFNNSVTKYKYNVTDVVIVSHSSEGVAGALSLGNEQYLAPYTVSDTNFINCNSLEDRKIDNLHLIVCYSVCSFTCEFYTNEPIEDACLALAFIDTQPDIEKVYGFDDSVTVAVLSNGRYSIIHHYKTSISFSDDELANDEILDSITGMYSSIITLGQVMIDRNRKGFDVYKTEGINQEDCIYEFNIYTFGQFFITGYIDDYSLNKVNCSFDPILIAKNGESGWLND